MIIFLKEKNITIKKVELGGSLHEAITITPKGYDYLESLNKNRDSQIGFCTMWFDNVVKPAWIEAIKTAILAAGYYPKRINEHEHTEGVVDEIISLIRRSRFLIIDLTGGGGGVYYEAGFAKALGLKVILPVMMNILSKDILIYSILIV